MESLVGRQNPQVLWNNARKALKFFKILDRHPNYTHSSSSFDHIIEIAGRMRDYKTLWSLHGCPPNLNSFNNVLDFLCITNLAEKAYNLFKALRVRFKVDTVSYNILLQMALEVLEEMVKKGLNPNLSSYNIMLKGYLRAGQIKEAWEFFLEIKKRKCEIIVVTNTTLAHGYGVMVKKDCVMNLITYIMLIIGLCHVGEMEKALEFMDSMMDDELESNGLSFFEKMYGVNCLPNLVTYNVLIGAIFVRKKLDDLLVARKLLIEMVGRGFSPLRLTFNRVLYGYLLTSNQGFAK
ncbi:hypothetical protein UlMin_026151 [Ulmus minor]